MKMVHRITVEALFQTYTSVAAEGKTNGLVLVSSNRNNYFDRK